MTDDGDSKHDKALWDYVTSGVRRLTQRPVSAEKKTRPPEDFAAMLDEGRAPARRSEKSVRPESASASLPMAPLTPPARPAFPATDIDVRTENRFKRGQMEIEARLDLHGFSQAQAEEALAVFIRRAAASGKRCVLVITGKGLRKAEGTGILRKRVPEWLSDLQREGLVLRWHEARQRDGGAGALYILLRRQRD